MPDRVTLAPPPPDGDSGFPSAAEYATAPARHGALSVVDLQAEQAAITGHYDNRVLLDANDHCMRLAVFEGNYRWHRHPDSDELFLVVAGGLEIDLEDGARITLAPWQAVVIPAGTVHRTRAIGRTVNATFERHRARTEFVAPPAADDLA